MSDSTFAGLVSQALAQGATDKPAAPAADVKPAKSRLRMGKNKPAAPVVVAPVVVAKPANKPAAKQASKPAPVVKATPVKPSAVRFYVKQSARPISGAVLFAYTHAWLVLSGLAAGGTMPRARATEIAGSTMVGYHLKEGNFALDAAGQLYVTEQGQIKWGTMRKHNADIINPLAQMMQDGEPNQYFKNKIFIAPVTA